MQRVVPVTRAGIVGSPPFSEGTIFPSFVTYTAQPNGPTVAGDANLAISPSVVTYAAAPLNPSLAADNNGTVAPGTFAYQATANAPDVAEIVANQVMPSPVLYAATPNGPVVADQAAGQVQPDVVAYAATALVPEVQNDANVAVDPSAVAYAAIANAPTVAAGAQFITPTTVAYAATENAPTVAADNNLTVSPSVLAYAALSNLPAIAADANVAVAPTSVSYAAAPNAPTVAEASGFLPTDIAGLQIWFDADDATTITEVSGRVSQWNDKSGGGNNIENSDTAERPVVSTINGNASILYTAANDETLFDLSVTTALDFGPESTVFIVLTPTDLIQSGLSLIFQVSLNGGGRVALFTFSGNTLRWAVTAGAGAQQAITGNALTNDETVWTSLRIQDDGDGSCDVLDSDGQTATVTVDMAPFTEPNRIEVAGSSAGTSTYGGHIHEIIAYTGRLSDAQRTQVTDYIEAKYTIAA